MKKIITLLFFVGFFASAFAQQDHSRQYGNQANSNVNPSRKYTDDNYAYSNQHADQNRYDENHQWNKSNNETDYAYNKDRDHADREDMRRNQYPHSKNIYQRKADENSQGTSIKIRIPLLQIILGIANGN